MNSTSQRDKDITLLIEGGTILKFRVDLPHHNEEIMISTLLWWLDNDILFELAIPLIFGVAALGSYLLKRRQTQA